MCNYGDKLMPELVSRCQVISLNAPPEKDIIFFCWKILKKEKVIIKDKIAIIEMIRKLYPDIRGIINTLQYNTIDNTIDEIKIIEVSIIYKEVLENIKKVDLNEIRRILRSNAVNYSDLYNFLFSSIDEFKSPGDMIIEIGDALYRDSFFSIKEINFMRFIARCIKEKYI
jgi:DNA polymerase III delta prime subunit